MRSSRVALASLLDSFCAVQADIASEARNTINLQALEDVYQRCHSASHTHAVELVDALDFPARRISWDDHEFLLSHEFHKRYLSSSAFIAHALAKPNGYAGDKDLMLMICERLNPSPDRYSRIKNRVYLELPAAEAVRRRISALTAMINGIRDANILNLACGPAVEIFANREVFKNSTHANNITLIDHDINTIRYLHAMGLEGNMRPRLGNAFRFIKGDGRVALPRAWYLSKAKPSRDFSGLRALLIPFAYLRQDLSKGEKFDVIYSAGLYDYIKYDQNNAKGTSGLTKFLFSMLKDGGRLLIGNYLVPSPGNKHKTSHRLMMEFYSDWNLIYRSKDELVSFCSALPRNEFEVRTMNEDLQESDLSGATIGFLEITKRSS